MFGSFTETCCQLQVSSSIEVVRWGVVGPPPFRHSWDR